LAEMNYLVNVIIITISLFLLNILSAVPQKIYSLEPGHAQERFLVQGGRFLFHHLFHPSFPSVFLSFFSRAVHALVMTNERRAGSIEQVHWTEPDNLFIVSPSGIEFYQIPNRDTLSMMEKARPHISYNLLPIKLYLYFNK
jgi:hypothetical protein